jgi:hypothetical protein
MNEGKSWSRGTQIPQKNDFSAEIQALEHGLLLSPGIRRMAESRNVMSRGTGKPPVISI